MRHCERSEAIQACAPGWIASSPRLLAMTGNSFISRAAFESGSRDEVLDPHGEERYFARPDHEARRMQYDETSSEMI